MQRRRCSARRFGPGALDRGWRSRRCCCVRRPALFQVSVDAGARPAWRRAGTASRGGWAVVGGAACRLGGGGRRARRAALRRCQGAVEMSREGGGRWSALGAATGRPRSMPSGRAGGALAALPISLLIVRAWRLLVVIERAAGSRTPLPGAVCRAGWSTSGAVGQTALKTSAVWSPLRVPTCRSPSAPSGSDWNMPRNLRRSRAHSVAGVRNLHVGDVAAGDAGDRCRADAGDSERQRS